LIDDFIVSYYIAAASVINGDETAQIRFYANDGPSGSPGSLIYDSGNFVLTPTAGLNDIRLSDLSVMVPDTITWTVLFGGLAVNPSANGGGLRFYDPPTIGSSDSGFFWANKDTGFTKITVIGGTPNNFYAQITANSVPEPTSLLLFGLGLIGLVGVKKAIKK
jgi:hypothetical protein